MKSKSNLLALTGLVLLAVSGIWQAIHATPPIVGPLTLGSGLLLLLAAFFTARDKFSQTVRRRSFRLGLGAGMAVFAALALSVFGVGIASRHHLRFDLSEDKINSLAPQTLKVLKDLDHDVMIHVFQKKGGKNAGQAKALLDLYTYYSDRINYQIVNPEENPGLARRFKVRDYGVFVLTNGANREKVKNPEERELTNALVRLGGDKVKKVYFLTGHGELSLTNQKQNGLSSLDKLLKERNFSTAELFLAKEEKVPETASVVVIAGPEKPLMQQEIKKLDSFLARGGGLLILLEPTFDAGLTKWLRQKGVIIKGNLILDPASLKQGGNLAWPTVMQYGKHEITAPLKKTASYFPLSRTVALAKNLPPKATGAELLLSNRKAWAETNMKELEKGQAEFDQNEDQKGPLPLGAILSWPVTKGKRAGLTVIGDAAFISNIHLLYLGNLDLILNTISYLARQNNLISITPKTQKTQPLLLKQNEKKLFWLIPVVFLPGLILLTGLIVYIRRRRVL
ncbi:GldG family protein [Dethiosulfatarculus sandiegensis]|uniref:Uncharacterized protein n=1 Tax=Dethiosulfatarculus sandiegensis TaxID=1429043 RepID=A0A0D2JW96_9BACT|nr:GldG family protein [Dethiosulfatarculus sandiegensis]KIX13875.1 hypothetical protein X474_11605 [Dethiosulfatarculus sandiegensis]